jgi:hypothetical protein
LLANNDSIGVPHGGHFGDCTNFTIPALLRFQSEKGKKGGRKVRKIAPCQHSKIGGKMKRKRTKRKQQGCDVAKVIDTVEQAVSTTKKVYRVIEPVVNALTNRRKTK